VFVVFCVFVFFVCWVFFFRMVGCVLGVSLGCVGSMPLPFLFPYGHMFK